MVILDLIFGFLLLFAGRRLFWLCVGIVGFLVGTQCAASLGFTHGGMALLVAFILGGLGAILAVAFEWGMVIFGVGFLGGGYLITNLFPPALLQDPYSWLIFVVGGIVGMCLMVIIFDWTLIMISSLLGATLITSVFGGGESMRELLFIASTVTGMVIQSLALRDTPDQKSSAGDRDANL